MVFRIIGRGVSASPATTAYRDLALMFMAAAPKEQQELDVEAEGSRVWKPASA
ncbi:MAG: hypothetical protein ACK5QW_08685 [Cyanobacteriota bacterium]